MKIGKYVVFEKERDTSIQEIPVYKPTVTESFKGEVEQKKIIFPTDLKDAEEHEFSEKYEERLIKTYKDDQFAHAAVEKYIDYIISKGVFITSKDKRAKDLIEQWMQEVNFVEQMRPWLRDALSVGNGYLELSNNVDEVPSELKTLNPCQMFVRRDNLGVITGYFQYLGSTQVIRLDKNKVITFEPYQIAHLPINKIGDTPYGIGILHPINFILQKKNAMIIQMIEIMRRKAENPLILRVGDAAHNIKPTPATINSVGQSVEAMNGKNNWIFPDYVNVNSVDLMGNIGDKFLTPIQQLDEQLFYGVQIPAVLMGMANVAEGLAKSQQQSWELRIKSIQAQMEIIIESQIFRRILSANGLSDDVHVEFEWGEPESEATRLEKETLIQLLGTFGVSPKLAQAAEKKLAQLFDFELDEEELEDQPLPAVPPNDLKRPMKDMNPTPEMKDKKMPIMDKETVKKVVQEALHIHESHKIDEKLSLKEYIGFNYKMFTKDIEAFIDSEEFVNREYLTFSYLPGSQQTQWVELFKRYSLAETLTLAQIEGLRTVLKTSFEKGLSIREISKKILEDVKPNVLEVEAKNGRIYTIQPRDRAINMARTETIRASNEGALKNYKDASIEKVEWVAAVGDRTCDYCESQNGMIMEIGLANERIPAHNQCRCAWAPVVQTITEVEKFKDVVVEIKKIREVIA